MGCTSGEEQVSVETTVPGPGKVPGRASHLLSVPPPLTLACCLMPQRGWGFPDDCAGPTTSPQSLSSRLQWICVFSVVAKNLQRAEKSETGPFAFFIFTFGGSFAFRNGSSSLQPNPSH